MEQQLNQNIFHLKTDTNFTQQNRMSNTTDKQLFTIYYDETIFKVDPNCLSNSSLVFNDLIKQYINDHEKMEELCLIIYGNQFSKRNMNNFLKICQNLPTDVQNSEIKEICEIAKMFKADEIYKTGIAFINAHIDPTFSIPDTKYGHNTMLIAHKNNHDEENNCNLNTFNNQEGSKQIIRKSSVIYTVLIENHMFKQSVFKLVRGNKIIFTAKQKYNRIYIFKDDQKKFKNLDDNIAYIYQNSVKQFNTIKCRRIEFDLMYTKSKDNDNYTFDISIEAFNQNMSLVSKPVKYIMDKDKYHLNFIGQYNHIPIVSPKNLVLQDRNGNPTFFVRKMDKNLFEIECEHDVNPLIAFTIGISDIVGPYKDPWANLSNYNLD